MTLQRLVLTFKPGEASVEIRALYRSEATPGLGPGTKARTREAATLAREGLRAAFSALEEGPVESIGTSGYAVRADTLSLSAAPRDEAKLVKGAKR